MSLLAFKNIHIREWKRVVFNKDIRLMCFVAPLLYGVILTSVYYQGRLNQLPMGVIDKDRSELSREFVRLADATENIEVAHQYASETDAENDIIDGKISGFIYLPANFSSDVKRGGDTHVNVAVSSSNFLIANPLITSSTEVASALSERFFIDNLLSKGLSFDKVLAITNPLQLSTDILFNRELNYSNFMIPPLLFAILQQIILVSIAFSMSLEREEKTLHELKILSMGSALAVIFAKTTPYILINTFIGLLFLFIAMPFFNISLTTNIFSIITLEFIFIVTVALFAFLISMFFKKTLTALLVLMFYSMPAFLMSGVSWPLNSLPLFNRVLSSLFPTTYFFYDWRMLILAEEVPWHFILTLLFKLVPFALICLVASYFIVRKILRQS
ncbi:MAG: ABC transporter permease [Oligoflexia bacterium]|nr:ABC transporter permease [Oligoflexia bacterium]MBF0365625.1 ABC transporter permease [Oligoflexia bacterium]